MFNPRVAAQLRRQAGVISRQQAVVAGMTERQVHYLLCTNEWIARLPRVYATAGSERTPAQRLWAASLYAGPQAILSHSSAGFVWQAIAALPTECELWLPAHRDLRAPGLIIHRTQMIQRVASRHVDGLRVTSPERTVVDIAPELDALELEWTIERLRSRRLLTIDSLGRALDHAGSKGRTGSSKLRSAVAVLASAASESFLEVRVARLIRASGLPAPERQLVVQAGGQKYRLDFAWSWRRVALECDGRRFHSDPTTFREDRERWTNIGARLGYRLVFVTWHDVETRPEWIAEQVADALR